MKYPPLISYRRFLLLVMPVLFISTVFAQTKNVPKFEHLKSEQVTIEKGLSQNTVQCIIQDQYGYLWFGTWDGLNKYNGYDYVIYNEENKLTNQNIQALAEDHDGHIWIGTEDGLNCYIRELDSFLYFKHDPRDEYSLVHNRIRSVMVGDDNRIYIGTSRGFSIYDKGEKKFYNYIHEVYKPNSLINNWVNDVFQDSKGNIWLATFRGFDKFDPKTETFIHYNKGNGFDALGQKAIWTIHEDKEGNILLGGREGFFILNEAKKKVEYFTNDPNDPGSLNNNMVNKVYCDSKGLIWIATLGGGVSTYDAEQKKFSVFSHEPDDLTSLSNDRAYSIFEDNSGIIWIGTFNGLNKYDRNSSRFRTHKHIVGKENSLNHNVVFGFFEDENGEVWVGTENGPVIFNPETGLFRDLEYRSIRDKERLSRRLVRTIYKDSKGFYWFATQAGLFRYDIRTKALYSYYADPSQAKNISSNSVWYFCEDNDGYLWVSTSNGLNKYIREQDAFISFMADGTNGLGDDDIHDIIIDKSGILWITTQDGFYWHKPGSSKFENYFKNRDNSLSTNQKRIQNAFLADDGIFWLGTMGGGLIKVNTRKGIIKAYTESDGLPNNVVYKPVADFSGNLWLPTNKGLSKFNIKNESFTNYDFKDGLQSNEFNLGASLITSKGQIFFGGMNGFNSFFPEEIRKNNKAPELTISSFLVFNNLKSRELHDGDTIELTFRQNFFAFEFAALDFSNPAKNLYKYYLDNFDKEWVTTDASDRIAEYTNVPPGTYTFKMIGSNNDGVWNDEGMMITLIITPPWYARWWFRAAMVLFVIASFWYIIRARFRTINKRHATEKRVLEIENQYYDLEQKALRLQMNPHFIFNTLNSIQSYVINNESDKAIDYLAMFSRLMRQILSNSSESYIAVKDEITALEYYLQIEMLRFEEKFDYELNIDPLIDDEFNGIPPMIIQPYVENAIIHGLMNKEGKGLIKIDLKVKDDSIFCTIEDNGVGRKKAMEIYENSGLIRKSRGMTITKQRLEILNRYNQQDLTVKITDLHDSENQPAGTRVDLCVPIVNL